MKMIVVKVSVNSPDFDLDIEFGLTFFCSLFLFSF